MDFLPYIYNQDIQLKEACWINDVPFFTRRAIGEWLEYKNPQIAIDHIIMRNPYIDDDRWATTLKLRVVDEYTTKHSHSKLECECLPTFGHSLPKTGSEYSTRTREIEMRIYNPVALQLITYESSQPKARAVKIATAQFVYSFMNGELKPPKDLEKYRLYLQCREILQLESGFERGVAVRYIMQKTERHKATVYRWLQRVASGETLERKEYPLQGRRYIKDEDIATMTAMIELNPSITNKEIIKRIPRIDCTAIGTVRNIKRQVKKQMEERVIQRLEGALLN
jgi:hypothetical protein